MKKSVSILAALCVWLSAFFTGCDGNEPSAVPPEDNEIPSGENQENPQEGDDWKGFSIMEDRPPRWTHAGIVYTAENPQFDYYCWTELSQIAEYSNWGYDEEGYEANSRFLAAFRTISEERGFDCYFLDPAYRVDGLGSYLDTRSFSAYAAKDGSVFIREMVNVTDVEYGTYSECYDNGEIKPGNDCDLLTFEFITSSAVECDGGELRLEFGKYPKSEISQYRISAPQYINIYQGEVCVGTCYYRERIPINYDWFYNYLSQNLFLTASNS